MITAKDKAKLQKHLKNDYIYDVLKKLEDHNITNRKGEPYSESMIRLVFNGRPHEKIEDALLAVYVDRKKAFAEREERKKNLLSA